MIKLLGAISLTLLLTACGSQSDSKETKETPTVQTDEKIEAKTTPEKIAHEKTTIETPTKEANKNQTKEAPVATPVTYAKNIFTLPTLEGKQLHIDEAEEGIIFQEHKGKVVFLLFFGYRCPPCLAEIPVLKAMTDEKHDDMEIIAIEVQRLPSEQLKLFKANKGINYTLLSGNEEQTEKFITYIGQRAQWGGSIPFLVALNPQGEVKVVHVGGMGSTQFKTIYDKLKLEK